MRSNKKLGSNQVAVRHYNERLVLHLIRKHGKLTKAQATRATALSPNAISTIFRSLEADNLLIKGEPDRGKLGQPSIPASINPDARYYLGLKIGRRSFDLVLLDFAGTIRARRSEFHPYPIPQDCIAFVEASIRSVLKEAKVARKHVSGFGVAMPGELWSWADETAAPHDAMLAWRDFDVAGALAKVCPWQIMVENDGTAACRSELMFGPHADKQDFVYFFVGTLIGGGVVLNSSVFSGRTGNAGGFGPLRVPSSVSGKDRLMDHASIFVLEQLIARRGQSPHVIWTEPDGWQRFPDLVSDWIETTARGLADAAVSSLSIIDFEAVVVDGAFPSDVRDRLVQAITENLEQTDLQGISKPRVEPGRWGGIARAVGAATLPLVAEYSVSKSPLAAMG